MKLNAELLPLEERLKAILPKIKEYMPVLKESGDYNNFEVRLAWDCLRATTPIKTICSWYEKYDCNDSHITTLAKKALSNVLRG